jgi:hypothetical protein
LGPVRSAPEPITSRWQQTQRAFPGWLRVEYAIEKPSTKLLTVAELNSDAWVGEVKCFQGRNHRRPAPAFTLCGPKPAALNLPMPSPPKL